MIKLFLLLSSGTQLDEKMANPITVKPRRLLVLGALLCLVSSVASRRRIQKGQQACSTCMRIHETNPYYRSAFMPGLSSPATIF